MGREIKFRAWDAIEKKMWVPIIDTDGYPCARHPITQIPVRMDGELLDPVMQFTGLHDKNGKPIFEGDIVRINWLDRRYENVIDTVIWCDKNACFEFGAGAKSEVSWSHEVIGNIYENPELLENG